MHPDNIIKGKFVTIREWKPREVNSLAIFAFGGMENEPKVIRDRSWCGDVLEVVAVNIPFILCVNHSETWLEGKPLQLDIRQLELMELNKEYVDLVIGHRKQKTKESANSLQQLKAEIAKILSNTTKMTNMDGYITVAFDETSFKRLEQLSAD